VGDMGMSEDNIVLNQILPDLDSEDKLLLETLRDKFDNIEMKEYILKIEDRLNPKNRKYEESLQINLELELCLFLTDLGKESGNLDAIESGKNKLEEIFEIKPDLILKIDFHYNVGNAYSGIAELNLRNKDVKFFDKIVYENYLCAMFHHSIATRMVHSVQTKYDAMLFTNCAYTLFLSNRYLEAVKLLSIVLVSFPKFAHAHSTMFKIIPKYVELEVNLPDFLMNKSIYHLTKSIEFGGNGNIQKPLLNILTDTLNKIENNQDVKSRVKKYENDLKISNAEFNKFSELEKFSILNHLILNSYSSFTNAHSSQFDTISIIDGIPLSGFEYEKFEQILNLLKSEYSHSRYLYYESLLNNPDKKHIAGTHVYELFDNVPHSYEIQAIRTAFRIAYSILDKISVAVTEFINFVIEKDIDTVHKNIKKTQYVNFLNQKPVLKFFKETKNPFSIALFTLVKEINIGDEDKKLKLKSPLGKLKDIRNNLEHNFCFITDGASLHESSQEKISHFDFIDKTEFEKHTLDLLQYARCAILYFAEFIRFELRNRKDNEHSIDNIVISIPLNPK